MTAPTPQPHLFLLWSRARSEEARILADAAQRFRLRRVFELRWSAERFGENLTRFYGEKLPPGSRKELHCGNGPMVALIVDDRTPRTELRATSRGNEEVNAATFDAKACWREWTGGGHKIHGTNSPAEVRHDLALLFGREADEMTRPDAPDWDGRIEPRAHDLAGAGGWRDLAELFFVLDATLPYVVLRNFAGLLDDGPARDHPDIDLLVERFQAAAWIVNGRPTHPRRPERVQVAVDVGGRRACLDLRHVGDGYFDAPWQRELLARRVRDRGGLWVPSAEDHFHSLAYHALIHKPALAADYVARLQALAPAAGVAAADCARLGDRAALRERLQRWMTARGYAFTEPYDRSVHFEAASAGRAPSLRRRAHLALRSLRRLARGRRSD